jgi:hypothetical protein
MEAKKKKKGAQEMKARLPLSLTNKERKALEDEIDRQMARNVKNLSVDLQALVLWMLREQLGFGKKRLLRFQKAFLPMIRELQRFYEVRSADDTDFICKYKLKQEVGIDVEELDAMFQFQIVVKE